ncbi:MAG: hypothetical protein M3R36_04295 [Bacteroidota bacterium]|nr:hypothetical protein [Bacteroidota bacterium]
MVRSFDGVIKIILEILQRDKEFVKYIFEYYDKFNIWIVGFSVAGISIIITNLSNFQQVFSLVINETPRRKQRGILISRIIYSFAASGGELNPKRLNYPYFYLLFQLSQDFYLK